MKKDKFNNALRYFARTLSPQESERNKISQIYKSFCDLLGDSKCLQIGSYPRFTSITPVHDLDILFIVGIWSDLEHTPAQALQKLKKDIDQNYTNPTEHTIKVILQTHSVTITYFDNLKEILSVDIVPAYILGKNEFKLDNYKVPEVLKKKHGEKRQEFYKQLYEENKEMRWINSDPRGYIKLAIDADNTTKGEFRKSTKVIKHWIRKLSETDNNLKLKSFHAEQIVIDIFKNAPYFEIYDVVFKFFCELPNILNNPNQIPDRANNGKSIDDYLEDFTEDQKQKIINARDGLLIKLESFDEEDSIENLFEIYFYRRSCINEEYLFDKNIPVLTNNTVGINGWIQKNNQDFRRLNEAGYIDHGYRIRFEAFMSPPYDLHKWKVKNDNKSPQPRGEITDNQTKNTIEETKYTGIHFVECFVIKNNICIAKARQNVVIS